jgi:hypothetical protein
MAKIDDYQGLIFQLYTVQVKPLKEVMKRLKDEHGYETTSELNSNKHVVLLIQSVPSARVFKLKLKQWYFEKSITTGKALAYMQDAVHSPSNSGISVLDSRSYN